MKSIRLYKLYFFTLTLVFFGQITSIQAHAKSDYKTSQDLVHDYPNIGEFSERRENKKILCPFHRLLERAGVYDSAKPQNNSQIMVSIIKMTNKAREFGCKIFGCGSVATLVSTGQLTHGHDLIKGKAKFGYVNITRLHKARGVAHECGLTFDKFGTEVSDSARASTLARFKEISGSNNHPGELSKEDLMLVKKEICKKQGVMITRAGAIEVALIYSYLGGHDRGFIEYDDVARLFHAEMPKVKSLDGI